MRTFWIVKVLGSEVFITENRPECYESAIGPYFSYKEAMAVLNYWL